MAITARHFRANRANLRRTVAGARRTTIPLFAALIAVGFGLGPGLAARAYAQAPPPAQRLQIYSSYEQQTIAEVLRDKHLVQDVAPAGKRVERIDVVPLPPFEKRDVLPQWLNIFHWTTRASVVRQEVLLHEGGLYEQAAVDDSIRNLRRLPGVPQLSAVMIVAAAGSAPDRVVVVVITKDVWSLRLNWNAIAGNGGIDQLVLQPSETNFLGLHQVVGALFVYEPSTYTYGLNYVVPRIGASRVAMSSYANVMVNRASGSPEGTYGQLIAGQPLFSGTTEWAWDSTVAWQEVVARRYTNAQLSEYVDPATGGRMPFQYRQRTYLADYELTRSFGWDVNHDFTLSASVNRAVYTVDPPPGTSPQTVSDFVSQDVPVSDTRVGPTLQYHTYQMRYLRVVDFDTLALQEDYRLGHDVVLRAYPSFRALGASRDVFGFYGAAQYTWALRDGLFRVLAESTTEPQLSQGGGISDASFLPAAHLVTPTVAGIGRLVVDGAFVYRWRNYLNQTTFLGGDDRLRGYPTNFFVGADVLAYNVEARTRPIEMLSCQVAGALFFDAGDAYTPGSKAHPYQPYQSLGFGIRGLFPWLDRSIFRVDFAFPLERPIDPTTGTNIPPFTFILEFLQAFVTPTIPSYSVAGGTAVSPVVSPPVTPTPVLPTGQASDAP
jgi:hypothetical protein